MIVKTKTQIENALKKDDRRMDGELNIVHTEDGFEIDANFVNHRASMWTNRESLANLRNNINTLLGEQKFLSLNKGLIRVELSDNPERRMWALEEFQTIIKCWASRMRDSWGHDHSRTIGICEDIEQMVRGAEREGVLTEEELHNFKSTLIDLRGFCFYRNPVQR